MPSRQKKKLSFKDWNAGRRSTSRKYRPGKRERLAARLREAQLPANMGPTDPSPMTDEPPSQDLQDQTICSTVEVPTIPTAQELLEMAIASILPKDDTATD